MTELVDETGKSMMPNNISLNLINGTSRNGQFHVTLISMHKIGIGSFTGYIIAKKGTNEIISLPVTIATRPLVWESISLVIIGVCISVCVWEIILQYRDSKKEVQNKEWEQKSTSITKEASMSRKVALQRSSEVQEIHYLASEGLARPLDFVLAPIAKHTADYLLKDAEAKKDEARNLQKKIAKNGVHISKRQKRNNTPLVTAGRIALIELAPSLFGIFIAMFAVLNEQIVVGTAVLSSLLVAKLIGIGLATGSLKQLIDK